MERAIITTSTAFFELGKLSAKEGGEVPLIYVKHLAFVNGNNWSLSIVGETNIHESVPHLYYWFWEILKVTLKVPRLTPRTQQRRWALRDASTAASQKLLAGAEKQVLRNKSSQGGGGGERLMEVVYISKSILQYLVSDENWKAKLLAVCLQLKLDGGERNDNHCRWTLTEHIVTCNRHMTKESYPVEGAGLR